MEKTLTVVFDGEVFRPESPVDLTPNTSYEITVREMPPVIKQASVWEVLAKYTGSIDGPEDWSIEHDHYLYGTPKRNEAKPERVANDSFSTPPMCKHC